MSNYTSPNPPNVAYNGNMTTWWIPAKNLGPFVATNVKVTISVNPSNSLQLLTYQAQKGTFDIPSGIWNIGTLGIGEEKYLKIVTKVVDIGLAPYTITYTISGDNVDPNNVNNSGTQTLTSVVGCATAAANDSDNKCSCVDVTTNDIPCNVGITEWKIQPSSITNCDTYTWDGTTGTGRFTHKNPFEPVTFTYNIFCDSGTGGVQTAGPALVTLDPLFDSASSWDHSMNVEEYSEMNSGDKDFVDNHPKYNTLDPNKVCWRTLRNVEGTLLSIEPISCREDIDTRTFFICSDEECVSEDIACPCSISDLPVDVASQLPVGYKEEKGDTIVILHPFATSYWTYDGTGWVRNSCGCITKAPALTSIEVTGDGYTKTIELEFEDESQLTASFVIPSTEWVDFNW